MFTSCFDVMILLSMILLSFCHYVIQNTIFFDFVNIFRCIALFAF